MFSQLHVVVLSVVAFSEVERSTSEGESKKILSEPTDCTISIQPASWGGGWCVLFYHRLRLSSYLRLFTFYPLGNFYY
jgi:hypothetical protein